MERCPVVEDGKCRQQDCEHIGQGTHLRFIMNSVFPHVAPEQEQAEVMYRPRQQNGTEDDD